MQHRFCLVCLLSLALLGCGASDTVFIGDTGTVTPAEQPSPEATPTETAAAAPAPQIGDADRTALLAQADRLAEEHDGRALHVVAVRTMTSTAQAVTGWSTQHPDEAVWVLAISGDDYFCRFCSGPSDEGKRSKHLTLTVRAEDPSGERYTDGMALVPYDLSAYGPVQTLRGG